MSAYGKLYLDVYKETKVKSEVYPIGAYLTFVTHWLGGKCRDLFIRQHVGHPLGGQFRGSTTGSFAIHVLSDHFAAINFIVVFLLRSI